MQSACIIYVNNFFPAILHIWGKTPKCLVCYNFLRMLQKIGVVLQVACGVHDTSICEKILGKLLIKVRK